MIQHIPDGLLNPERAVNPGLERTEALLARLGNPEGAFPAVHVAGTNGKGSVVAFLDSVLRAAGMRVGAYTSPDLGDPTERIRVSGVRVEASRLAELILEAVQPVEELDEGPGRPNEFEALTAAAFAHFAEQGVHVGVVEAGLGGRFDASRCLANPLLSLITSVSLDHREIFGPGLGRAAWEKAGVARQGVPLITVEDKPEVLEVFERECQEVGAALVKVDPRDVQLVELSWERAMWRSTSDPLQLGSFPTRMHGVYQGPNLALVNGALAELVGGMGIAREEIHQGLGEAGWPGRFEVLRRRPYVVLDAAHNPAAARGLADTLDLLPSPAGRQTLLFGALRGKLIRAMAEILFPRFDRVVLATPASDRALPGEALAHQARRCARQWDVGGSVGETASALAGELREDDALVVCGSLTIVGEARRVLAEYA
ncbi:MAG: folylpolyglutamate synthase/dihydrofolate synthase family protein [Candidatus Bipolaricaulota bacterium]